MNLGPLGFHPTVLVADDGAVERRMLSHVLQREGFPIELKEDGQQVLERLGAAGAPRLLLLDWEMPGRTGPELVRWLRARPGGEQYYVVLLTGRDALEDIVEGLDSGADDFISKPFRAGELVARLRAGARVLWLQQQLLEKVARLEAARAEVRQLRGLIPICMHCHRIRTEGEQWQRLEAYLEAHSDASFSHSLCDECLRTHYPEVAAERETEAREREAARAREAA